MLLAGALVALVFVAVAATWTAGYAVAVYRLNRGVGDTVFYDADGRPWFHLDEQRQDVPLDRIATSFKDAVIAVEDHRFYLHPGVDPIGLARALVVNLRSPDRPQGGSTLTQQLARTLFLSNAPTYLRKVQEAALAVMLEALLTKREILELYLNRVYLGGSVYGVEAMSQRALGKPASALTIGEAALIAGIIRAPATYSPWTHLDTALRRRDVVLQRMREEGKITLEQERAAQAERPRVRAQSPPANPRHGYAKEYLRQRFRDVFGGDNPPDWKVQTTFVPELQDLAEAAVRNGLRRLGVPNLQAALVALDPQTGNILAMVGGSDYSSAPFNRAVRSRRQPGSAFKPFVYAAALERGMSPVSVVGGLQHVAVEAPEGVWIPRDDRARGTDQLTLRDALLESSNAAAVALQQMVGARPVLRLVNDLGVGEQPEVPSLALGSGVVSPLELTAAYAVFPSLGSSVKPRGIVEVQDARGRTVQRMHVEREPVLRPAVAYQMVTMLRDVVDYGTAVGARRAGVRGPVGGKTGTTSDALDAWFVGFSSSVVVGVWVGFDQPRTIRDGASAARVAVPIWSEFMRRSADRLPARRFTPPANIRSERLCRISHQRALSDCPGYQEYFKEGDEIPSTLCPIHSGRLGEEVLRATRSVLQTVALRVLDLFR